MATRRWQESVVDNASFFLKKKEGIPERNLVWVMRKKPDRHTGERPGWGEVLIKNEGCEHKFTVCGGCLPVWLAEYDMDWERTAGGVRLYELTR